MEITKEDALQRWTRLVEAGERLQASKTATPEVERWKDNVRTALKRTLEDQPDLVAKFEGIRNRTATVHKPDPAQLLEQHRRTMATALAFVQARRDEIEQFGLKIKPDVIQAPGVGRDPKRAFLIDVREHGDDIRDRLIRLGITPLEWSGVTRDIGHLNPPVREIVALGSKRAAAVIVVLAGDVAFEAGIAIGIDPKQVVLVTVGDSFSDPDLGGHPVVGLDDLADALVKAGCTIGQAD